MLCKIKISFVLIVFFYLTTPPELSAQGLKRYSGPYETLTGLKGAAEFKFKEEDKGRIKEGPFEFICREKDSASNSYLNKIHWIGQYKNGEKDGSWTYEEVDHEFLLQEIKDFEPEYRLTSTVIMLEAMYSAGRPAEKWKYSEQKFVNGEATGDQFLISCNFEEGKVMGEYLLEYHSDGALVKEIKGEVDESGLMVGTWSFVYPTQKDTLHEIRKYTDGILTNLLKVNDEGDTLEFLDYPHSDKLKAYIEGKTHKEDLANLPLSLNFSDGYPRTSKYLITQRDGNELLDESLQLLFQHDFNFFKNHGLPLGTNRMYYELTDDEEEALKDWSAVEYELRKSMEEIKSLEVRNFLYTENDTLQWIAAWEKKQERLLDYIKPWDRIVLENELHFYYREGLLADYVVSYLREDSIVYNGLSRVITYDSPDSTKNSFVFYMVQNLRERASFADSLYLLGGDIIDHHVKSDQVELHLNALFRQKSDLDSLYRLQTSNNAVNRVFGHIRENLVMGDFSTEYHEIVETESNVDQRISRADSLAQKMDLARQVFEILYDVPEESAEIDELYTTYKFDPYTFSENVPVRRYKKIYNRIAVDLQASLLYKAQKQNSILEIYNTARLLERSHERLKYLIQAEHEAKKIERKMKRNLSTEKAINLLKI